MCHIVNIQSISDIITNSSSEVFPIRYKWGTEDELVELVDAILAAGGSGYTCEELFDITYDWGTLKVTPKITTRDVKRAASILANLENLFEACED